MTYYGADLRFRPAGSVSTGQYYAIDTTDLTKPKLMATWRSNVPGGGLHGLSVTEDGNRGYFISTGNINATTLLDPSVTANNGLLIYDLSQIQARVPNPQVRLVSSIFWKDGSGAQHSIPISINGMQ